MTESEVSQKELELRKYRNSLMITGKAMIALGAWVALRVILIMFLGEHNIQTYVETHLSAEDAAIMGGTETYTAILFVIVLVVCLFAFLLNYISGHGAYKEGKTHKKGKFYLVITVLIMVLTIIGDIIFFLPDQPAEKPASGAAVNEKADEDNFLNDSGSLLMDITLIALCGDILYSVTKSRKISEELEGHTA